MMLSNRAIRAHRWNTFKFFVYMETQDIYVIQLGLAMIKLSNKFMVLHEA